MKWLVGLFLVSCGATVWSFLSGDGRVVSSSLGDPVVETVRKGENTTLHIATFQPRIGRMDDPDIEYKHSFSLVNTGSEKMVVTESDKSCSCLDAKVDRKEISPGESATVQMAVNPSNLITKRGTFTLQMKSGAQHVFEMRTWTYPPAVIDRENDAIISFGRLSPGTVHQTTRRLLVYSYTGESPPELRWVPSEDENTVSCRLTDQGVEPCHDGQLQRRVYEMEVEIQVGKVAQLYSHEIRFAPVNSERSGYDFSATVVWNVGSPINVEPARWIVNPGEISDQAVLEKTVTLQELRGMEFQVTEIESSHACLTVTPITLPESSKAQIELHLNPAEVPPAKNFLGCVKLRIEIAEPSQTSQVLEKIPVLFVDSGDKE